MSNAPFKHGDILRSPDGLVGKLFVKPKLARMRSPLARIASQPMGRAVMDGR